jgi:hypothetical protein
MAHLWCVKSPRKTKFHFIYFFSCSQKVGCCCWLRSIEFVILPTVWRNNPSIASKYIQEKKQANNEKRGEYFNYTNFSFFCIVVSLSAVTAGIPTRMNSFNLKRKTKQTKTMFIFFIFLSSNSKWFDRISKAVELPNRWAWWNQMTFFLVFWGWESLTASSSTFHGPQKPRTINLITTTTANHRRLKTFTRFEKKGRKQQNIYTHTFKKPVGFLQKEQQIEKGKNRNKKCIYVDVVGGGTSSWENSVVPATTVRVSWSSFSARSSHRAVRRKFKQTALLGVLLYSMMDVGEQHIQRSMEK